MLRRTLPLFLLASIGFVAFASSDSAQAADEASPSARRWRPPPWRPQPVQAQFHAELIDDNMAGLPTFLHNGKKFVMGTMGQRYRIRVTNPTSQRVEAVVSVDGLDAIDGQTASTSKRGYIVPAFGTVTIDGFRTSMSSVAAFRFSAVSESFAGRTGQDRNVGVIGVAIFREKVEQPIEIVQPRAAAPAKKRAAAADESAASGARKPMDRPGLGTQFGEQHESRVRTTVFIRDSQSPTSTIDMRYNDRAGLRALGIAVDPVRVDDDVAMRETATPFPGDRRFAQPPP